jgi:hypothetical protein
MKHGDQMGFKRVEPLKSSKTGDFMGDLWWYNGGVIGFFN